MASQKQRKYLVSVALGASVERLVLHVEKRDEGFAIAYFADPSQKECNRLNAEGKS
jgi:hypothetical protein